MTPKRHLEINWPLASKCTRVYSNLVQKKKEEKYEILLILKKIKSEDGIDYKKSKKK